MRQVESEVLNSPLGQIQKKHMKGQEEPIPKNNVPGSDKRHDIDVPQEEQAQVEKTGKETKEGLLESHVFGAIAEDS